MMMMNGLDHDGSIHLIHLVNHVSTTPEERINLLHITGS